LQHNNIGDPHTVINMEFSQSALPVRHHNVFRFTSLTAKLIRQNQRQQLATNCCQGGSHHTGDQSAILCDALHLVAA